MFTVNIWSGLWTLPGIHPLAPRAAVTAPVGKAFGRDLRSGIRAGAEQCVWFVILIVVNTIGILPIIYLFAVARLQGLRAFQQEDIMLQSSVSVG